MIYSIGLLHKIPDSLKFLLKIAFNGIQALIGGKFKIKPRSQEPRQVRITRDPFSIIDNIFNSFEPFEENK
jgi:hypothetical protein